MASPDSEYSLKPRRDETPAQPPERLPLPWLETPGRLALYGAALPVLVGAWVLLWREAANKANDPAVFWPDTLDKLAAVAGMGVVVLLACVVSGWCYGFVARRIVTAAREAPLPHRHRARMVIVVGLAGYTLNALVYYHALFQDFALITPIVFQPYIPTLSLMPGTALGMGLGWLAATFGPPPLSRRSLDTSARPSPPKESP